MNNQDNVFDKTQSTVGYVDRNNNATETFSTKTYREDNVKERDFTPLKDKLG